jgi:hypothetical protein
LTARPPATPAAPATVTFSRRRWGHYANLVFWGAEAVFGAALVIAFALGQFDGAISYVIPVLAIFLFALGAVYVRYCIRELRAEGPAIVIGPGGLHDRRISAKPVPWADIARVEVVRSAKGMVSVMFEIVPAGEARAGIYGGPRFKSRINRAFGFPGYDLIRVGNDASAEGLIAAIQPFKPVRNA